ncbi:hypothetical protein FSARC_9320 [Fusarium sarcochroum]|uniref:DUF6604 domain-containing protein n=1 Tax=Fusarium sarcochroum TaxID=1208366 RepID=A0A8H4TR85_9HYPO|nr:hypothetical protein FSARC_9320 [Fusarium sarcochroum]
MLPSSLRSIYQHSEAPVVNSNNPAPSSARLRGKARKQAKAAKNNPQAQPSSSSTTAKPDAKHVIRIRDFEPMAKHVAESNAVEVPHRLAVALERVIWVRKSFAQRLGQSGARKDRRSDASHSYFVGVLEKVRDYLKPFMEAGVFQPEDSSSKTDKKSDHVFKNMFDVLNVYTPSESFLNAPDVATPTPAPTEEYTVEEADTWEDAVFAYMALLGDLDHLKQEVFSLWSKYSAGKLDLAAVAVATNMAFELAHSMEDEVRSLLDQHEGAATIANTLFLQLAKNSGIDIHANKKQGDAYNVAAYDLAKPFQLNTMSLLKSYVDGSKDVMIINNYNGKFGWYDEKLGSGGKTNREKWDQDMTAMMENGGEHCDHGYKQMQQESLKIQKAMLDVPGSPQRKAVLEVAIRWNKDPMWMAREELINSGIMSGTNPPRFQFLRHNPLHCCLLIHHMRATLHISAVQYAAPSGGLMCTTQLYHALRQEKRLTDEPKWEDLESFWGFQGNPCFFVGDPPVDREGYYRNYCLCLGLSASNWAPNRRNAKPVAHKANARNMKFDGWVSLSTNQRLASANERAPWSIETVEELLTEGRRKETQDGKGHVQPALKEKAKEANLDAIPKTPSGLVGQLAVVLDAEVPRISFNYFNMHDVSWKLLTKLKESFTEVMGPEFLRYVPSEDQLPFVVGYVFSTASGHASSDVREKQLSSDAFIDVATEVVREFLADGKGRVIKEGIEKRVRPSEVARLDFDSTGLWQTEASMLDLQRMAGTRNQRPSGARNQRTSGTRNQRASGSRSMDESMAMAAEMGIDESVINDLVEQMMAEWGS